MLKRLDPTEPLTGEDYLVRPTVELVRHPGYSPHAFRVMNAIKKLKTSEIEAINIVEAKNSER